MPTPEEQKKIDEQKAADAAQQSVNDSLSLRLSKPVDHNQQFTFWENIANALTDKNTRRPDWIKLVVAGLGGIAGGIFGGDLGPLGMAFTGIAGTLISGFAGSLIVDMLRGDNNPNKNPGGLPVRRPDAPDANEKVIAQTPVILPAVAPVKLGETKIDVPVYDPTQNPVPPALRKDIEAWRQIVAQGNQFKSVVNLNSRAMLAELESKANIHEMNLRYLRDTLPDALKIPASNVDAYLQKLGPDALKALSIKLDGINLNEVPGQKENLPPELEAYGAEIKARLLQELASLRGTSPVGLNLESAKVIVDSTWNDLSVIAKRNLISNFADEMILEAKNKKIDHRLFFPEYEMTPDNVHFVNPHSLNPTGFYNTIEDQFTAAYKKQDYKAMADILQQRLDNDKDQPEGSKLSQDAKNNMRVYILGLKAATERDNLDAYIKDTLKAKDLPKLDAFEKALKQQSQKVATLNTRMQAFAQSSSKYLMLEQSPLERAHQTIKMIDARGATPKTVAIDLIFEAGSKDKIKSIKIDGTDKTSLMANSVLPADDLNRTRILGSIIESIPSLSQNTLQQMEKARGTTPLEFASTESITFQPSNPNLPTKNERQV